MQEYFINNTKLDVTHKEKDLGVLVTDNLKPSSQCVAAANKAMVSLRQSRRSFKYLDMETFKILYKTYIRPNMEFCIQAWCPYMVKDIQMLEKVQRRATRLVPALRHLPYGDRLKKLGIYTLSARRLRGDLIETFKLLHNYTDINYRHFFQRHGIDGDGATSRVYTTRGHRWKLYKPQPQKGLQCRTNFFSHRVINKWNSLPCQVVSAGSVNSFKSSLDKYYESHIPDSSPQVPHPLTLIA